jgi:hypothetical protein
MINYLLLPTIASTTSLFRAGLILLPRAQLAASCSGVKKTGNKWRTREVALLPAFRFTASNCCLLILIEKPSMRGILPASV